MSWKSEYNRGKRFSKKELSRYTSFKRDSQGRIIANIKGGGTISIGHLGSYKPKDPFLRANYDELKKTIQTKKPRPRGYNRFKFRRPIGLKNLFVR